MNLRDLTVEYDQDQIKNVSFNKGQSARPLWQKMETLTPGEMVLWIDRLDSLCPFASEWALTRALESSADLNVGQREEFSRTAFAEINRLIYLTTYLSQLVKALGLDYLYERGLVLREIVFQIQEELTGGRILPQVLKIGGSRRMLALGDLQKISSFVNAWRKSWQNWLLLLDGDDILRSRLEGLLVLSKSFITAHGVWGLCGKAAGVGYDSRIHQPHGAYPYLNLDFKFEFPLSSDGLTRMKVAIKEVEWSLEILEAVIKNIPSDASKEVGTVKFRGGYFSGVAESAKGPVTSVIKVNKNGEIQNVRVFTVGQRIWPHIENLLPGQKAEDLSLCWASLGMSGEEAEV